MAESRLAIFSENSVLVSCVIAMIAVVLRLLYGNFFGLFLRQRPVQKNQSTLRPFVGTGHALFGSGRRRGGGHDRFVARMPVGG